MEITELDKSPPPGGIAGEISHQKGFSKGIGLIRSAQQAPAALSDGDPQASKEAIAAAQRCQVSGGPDTGITKAVN